MVGMWPYTHGILSAAAYTADAAAFDGVNDNLASTSALSTAADGQDGILSLWIRLNSTAGDGVLQYIFNSSNDLVNLFRSTDNNFRFQAFTSTFGTVFDHTSTGAYTSTSGWINYLASWNSTAGFTLYINDSTAGVGALPAVSTRTIDYTVSEWQVGARLGANRLYADLFDFYFNISTSITLSAANRAKFISGGKPVSLSSDGSTVTGTAPIMFLHIDDGSTVTDFATNFGSGSSFAITGTLVTSTSSPTD